LCEQLAGDLQRKGFVGKTIGIKLKYHDYTHVTRDQTIDVPTNDAATIRRTAGLCLKRVDLTRRFRLLGVKVGHLSREGAVVEPPKKAPSAVELSLDLTLDF
jgi:DNA polymerase-4